MRTSVDGAAWSFIEVPRQLAATADWHPRINGHSGFEPPGHPALATVVNTFPSPPALAALDEHDVRYVIIRTALANDLGPHRNSVYGRDRIGVINEGSALGMIDAIPHRRVVSVEQHGTAYLIELR